MTAPPVVVPEPRDASSGAQPQTLAAEPAPAPARTASPAAQRFGWLDALRGFAALVVAYFHLAIFVLPHGRDALAGWVALGPYGVLLFFVVSGYVIPMSLERYRSMRQFWVGRIFRIYPAWLFAVALTAVFVALDVRALNGRLVADPVSAMLAHGTMMQDLLGVPNLNSVFWTLSYEMLFYVLMSALFVLGWQHRVAWWAIGLAVAAVLGGRALPGGLLTAYLGRRVLVAAVAAGLLVSIAAYLSGRRKAALVAAVVGLGALVLPATNGDPGGIGHAIGSWQSLSYLAVMFSGTVIYAAQHGRIARRTAGVTLALVFGCLFVANWLYSFYPQQSTARVAQVRAESVGALVAVAVTFGIAFALRHRRVPGWMAWLGQISYSVYLLHYVLLAPLAASVPTAESWPFPVQLGVGVAYLLLVVSVSWLAYRFVELPGQRLGKRVSRWLNGRLPADRSVTPRPANVTAAPAVTR